MVSAQESLDFRAHAQQKSVLTCTVVQLPPWPHVTVLCGLNCLSNSKRDAGGKDVTKVCSHLLHQWLDKLFLLIAEHVCRCLETAILVSGVHRKNTALDETGNQTLGIDQSSAKHNGSDRPTQPKNQTHSMNHAGDTHQMKMGVFSRRVSLKLNSSGAKISGQMLVTTDDRVVQRVYI